MRASSWFTSFTSITTPHNARGRGSKSPFVHVIHGPAAPAHSRHTDREVGELGMGEAIVSGIAPRRVSWRCRVGGGRRRSEGLGCVDGSALAASCRPVSGPAGRCPPRAGDRLGQALLVADRRAASWGVKTRARIGNVAVPGPDAGPGTVRPARWPLVRRLYRSRRPRGCFVRRPFVRLGPRSVGRSPASGRTSALRGSDSPGRRRPSSSRAGTSLGAMLASARRREAGAVVVVCVLSRTVAGGGGGGGGGGGVGDNQR